VKSLIALIGEAQVGKDTVYRLMATMGWPVTRRAFADHLKAEMQDWLRSAYGIDPFTCSGEQKSNIRDLLVAHGRCRRRMDPDYWITSLAKTLHLVPGRTQVITDCRYLNEATWVRARGGLLVRVVRPGFEAANDEEKTSLAEIDKSNLPMVLLSNHGTIDDLQKQTITAVLEINNEPIDSRSQCP